MDGLMIASLVIGLLLLLMVASVVHRLWRVRRGDEELEAGGSLGRQFFGRDRDRR